IRQRIANFFFSSWFREISYCLVLIDSYGSRIVDVPTAFGRRVVFEELLDYWIYLGLDDIAWTLQDEASLASTICDARRLEKFRFLLRRLNLNLDEPAKL